MGLLEDVNQRALELGIPLNVQVDVTWRCNERCVHCYVDHNDKGEMTTAEVKRVLQELAVCGALFVTLSGGEPFVRQDFLEIVEFARELKFSVRIDTNGLLVNKATAEWLRRAAVEKVQISVYSDVAEVHDAITKVRGSFGQSITAIQALREAGVDVCVADVLMRSNAGSARGVRELARQFGVSFRMDPTITPMMNGDRSTVDLQIPREGLEEIFHNEELVGDVSEFCSPPNRHEYSMDGFPCGAGHTSAYISPYGDVFPCVQFPMSCGNIRSQRFGEIWRESSQLREVRAIRGRDLYTCRECVHLGSCTRCPGLAYMEGDMRGISSADCEKAAARTGVPSATTGNLRPRGQIVQIAPIR